MLELNPADKAASTRYMIGKGRETRMGIHEPELEITDILSNLKIQSIGMRDDLLNQFQCNYFCMNDGEKYLNYHLFIPHMEKGKNIHWYFLCMTWVPVLIIYLRPLPKETGQLSGPKKNSRKNGHVLSLHHVIPE